MDHSTTQPPFASQTPPIALPSLPSLSTLPHSTLEALKLQLEQYRHQILHLQNSASPLLKLPPELRNRIFLYAMHSSLSHRRKSPIRTSNSAALFAQPDFFRTCRQIWRECASVWVSEVLVWEEFRPALAKDEVLKWRNLGREEVRELCVAKSEKGRRTLVVQASFCGMERTRKGQEESLGVCERRGVVWVKGGEEEVGLRWWVW